MDEEFFIPDTNCFIYDPEGLLKSFRPKEGKKNYVVLSTWVFNELDSLKLLDDPSVSGPARSSLGLIRDIIRDSGSSLAKGIEANGVTYISFDQFHREFPNFSGSKNTTDHYLVKLGMYLKKIGKKTTLITQDTTPYAIASIVGLEAELWKDALEVASEDDVYKGWRKLKVPQNQIKSLNTKKMTLDNFLSITNLEGVHPNEYFFISSDEEGGGSMQIFYANPFFSGGQTKLENITDFKPIVATRQIKDSLTLKQKVALHALHNPYISNVNLLGPAGTGKTILALDAGYKQIDTEGEDGSQNYRNILVTRPIIPVGDSVGYIPGGIEEKMAPWMSAIWDNLDQIVDDSTELTRIIERSGRSNGTVVVQELAKARGRSIPGLYWIIDDAQNTTKREMKLIGTRPAEGSKLIIAADLSRDQIDNSSCSPTSNGAIWISEGLKNDEESATIYLDEIKRSSLARKIAELR
ncbi:hypothetical protein GOV05_00825 [Candidatus Woesearchaeota archaeon]|nr:hypothetical protein [Candidatus Woesearchaeota archaeon]